MKKVGIIGVGNMGEVILSGLREGGYNVSCAEKREERAAVLQKKYGIEIKREAEDIVKHSDILIIAVKPQDAKKVLERVKDFIRRDAILISIMAGVNMLQLQSMVGGTLKMIRLMPNICIRAKEGIVAMTANELVEKDEIEYVKEMFSHLGMVIQVEEKDMDAITALSGSGPAFVLLFLEGMIEGGVKAGFSRELSQIISLKVLKGILKMLEEEKIHPVIMREMITSPSGTTASGLLVLEERGFKASIIKAIEAAKKRSSELSKSDG